MNPPPARRLGVSFVNPTAPSAGGRLLTLAWLLPTLSEAALSAAPGSLGVIRLDAVVITALSVNNAERQLDCLNSQLKPHRPVGQPAAKA